MDESKASWGYNHCIPPSRLWTDNPELELKHVCDDLKRELLRAVRENPDVMKLYQKLGVSIIVRMDPLGRPVKKGGT